jgi:anti-sigma factor RsiW
MRDNNLTNRLLQHPCGLIDDFLVGDLPADLAERFEQHLAECADCGAAVAEQRWIDGLLRSPEAQDLEAAPPAAVDAVGGTILRLRRRTAARRLIGVAAAASVAAIAAWHFSGPRNEQRPLQAPSFAQKSNSRAIQETTGPVESAKAATFVTTGDAIAVPVASDDAQVSIVKVYPTTSTERRWRRELFLNADRAGQDGG